MAFKRLSDGFGQGFLPARTERDNEGPVRFRPRKTLPPNRREQQQMLTAGRRFVSGRKYAAKRESRLVTAQVLRPLAERSDSYKGEVRRQGTDAQAAPAVNHEEKRCQPLRWKRRDSGLNRF